MNRVFSRKFPLSETAYHTGEKKAICNGGSNAPAVDSAVPLVVGLVLLAVFLLIFLLVLVVVLTLVIVLIVVLVLVALIVVLHSSCFLSIVSGFSS